MIYSCKY